jgi:hypothetical protein
MIEIDIELVEQIKKTNLQKKHNKKDTLSMSIETFIKSTEESIEKSLLQSKKKNTDNSPAIQHKKIIVEM